MKKQLRTFDWNRTKQLSVSKLLLAVFIPSTIAFIGFHFVLPQVVNSGTPVLIAYGYTASTMLFTVFVVGILLSIKEAKELNITILTRLCFKNLDWKQTLIATLIAVIAILLSLLAGPLNKIVVNLFNINIPSYLPFFLNPTIDPLTADPMVISSGISLLGRWDILSLFFITIFLNILTEEIYFRGWLLPKLSKYGQWSWVINGTLFALYHTFQLWLLPVILIASLCFAFLTYKSRSILPALIAHLVLNSLNLIVLFPMFAY